MGAGEISVPSFQFCCNPKTSLKNEVLKKNIGEMLLRVGGKGKIPFLKYITGTFCMWEVQATGFSDFYRKKKYPQTKQL